MADQDNQGQFGNRPDTQQQAQKGGQMSGDQQKQRSSDSGMSDSQMADQESEEDMSI